MWTLGVQWKTMLGMYLGNSEFVTSVIERPWVAAPREGKLV